MPYSSGCHGCGAAAPEGARRCETCAREHRESEAARRAGRKAAGRCVVCGLKAARENGEALTVCPRHRAYYVARDAARRAARQLAKE